VDEDRDRAEGFHRRVERGTRAGFCRQIGVNERCAQLGCDASAALRVDIDEAKACAFSVQCARDRAPDSGSDSGDERPLS